MTGRATADAGARISSATMAGALSTMYRPASTPFREAEQTIAIVDQVDLDPQTAENRSIFAADDPGAIYDQGSWSMVELEDGIAIVDARMVEVHIGRTVRP